MAKGSGHNNWWRRRGAGGRFINPNKIPFSDQVLQVIEFRTRAEGLLLELYQLLEEHSQVKAFMSAEIEAPPQELFVKFRTFCIEEGFVKACPDCGGELFLEQVKFCETCAGKGYLIC